MENLLKDLRYALRIFRKKPAFYLIAVIVLALGIGANSAIFSIVDVMLIRPLPYRDSGRLVTLWHSYPHLMPPRAEVSAPCFMIYKEQGDIFDGIAATMRRSMSLTGDGEPAQIQAMLVTGDFFSTLGVSPLIGRPITPDDDRPGNDHVAVLSYELWQYSFGGQQQVLSQPVSLNGVNYDVIGVMPPHFTFLGKADLWLPMAFVPGQLGPRQHGNEYLSVVARLKQGLSLQQAQTKLDTISAGIRRQFPQFYPESSSWHASMGSLRDQLVGDFRTPLIVLAVAVGLVLLIACSNVANMLLVRSVARQKEIAIRVSFGASSRRLARQLLTENLLLAIVGSGLGLLLTYWAINALPAIAPSDFAKSLPGWEQIAINYRVVGFTMIAAVVTSLIFGLPPALQATSMNINDKLKSHRAGEADRSQGRLRNLLIVAQVAITFLLLGGSGLLIRSLLHLQQVDPGFRIQNIMSVQVTLPRSRYAENRQVSDFYGQALENLRSIPGVEAAGAISDLPLMPSDRTALFVIENRPLVPGEMAPSAAHRIIDADYFSVMNIPLISGQQFSDRDSSDSPPVVIIDDQLAERFWPGENPIGKRLSLTFEAGAAGPRWREVVGVVKHLKERGLDVVPPSQLYVPQSQSPMRSMFLVVRSPLKAASLLPMIKDAIAKVDPKQPIYNSMPMEAVLSDSIAPKRFLTVLMGVFAALALALATVGLYGVLSFSVSQRTHEIGVRMALGAQQSTVVRMVVNQGMRIALMGGVLGLVGAIILTRFISKMLFGVSALDPITYLGITLVLAAVTFLASYIPARRAARVDPMVVLRDS